MVKASDNEFPKVILKPLGLASAPADASWKLYPMADGVYARSSNSIVGPLGAGGSGAVATDVIWDVAGDLVVGTGANTAARLAIGTSGQALVSNGTTASWGRPKGAPVDFGFAKRTTGDISANNTAWTTTGIADLTLTAVSGDIIEVGVSVEWGNEATNGALDAATIVAAAPVNYVGSAGGASDLGVQAWLGLSGVGSSVGGSVMYTLQAGDIDTGTVVLRLMYRTTAAVVKTIRSSATQPFQWFVKNLGPAI